MSLESLSPNTGAVLDNEHALLWLDIGRAASPEVEVKPTQIEVEVDSDVGAAPAEVHLSEILPIVHMTKVVDVSGPTYVVCFSFVLQEGD